MGSVAVPQLGLSDHFPVCFFRRLNGGLIKKKYHQVIRYRYFKNFDGAASLQDLEKVPWQELAQLLLTAIMKLLLTPSSAYLMMSSQRSRNPREKRVKLERQPPWMKPEILSAMKNEGYLLH